MLLISLDLDEADCRMIESSSESARSVLRSAVSLPLSRRRVIVERREAEQWRDWFRNAGRHRAVEAIESRLPQPGVKRLFST
jgi:hypothetical protein